MKTFLIVLVVGAVVFLGLSWFTGKKASAAVLGANAPGVKKPPKFTAKEAETFVASAQQIAATGDGVGVNIGFGDQQTNAEAIATATGAPAAVGGFMGRIFS